MVNKILTMLTSQPYFFCMVDEPTWCRGLSRMYPLAQVFSGLTRNPYHKQDDMGIFKKVLREKFSIRLIWMRNPSPKKCLSDSISTDEKAKGGIILSESEIVYHTKVTFSS